MTLAVLGRIVEDDRVALDREVAALHGRQSVGLVGHRVVLAADPEEPAVQQPHRRRQHPLAPEGLAAQVCLDAGPERRQRPGELDHVFELLLVAALTPTPVVEVLLAPTLVDAGGLYVAAWVRADPDAL